MPESKVLEFPLEGRVVLRKGDPNWDALSSSPSQQCIDEIEEMERQNRQNVADFMRRNIILD